MGKAGKLTGSANLLFALLSGLALASDQPEIESAVVARDDAQLEEHEWGELLTYFAGQSWSSADALTAVAVIKPGMQIHPPHVHSEEEYLMVLKGEGSWSIEGREFPAKAGDILYAAPWDEHGISNTGSEPLEFVVFKWNPKPVAPMEKPLETIQGATAQ